MYIGIDVGGTSLKAGLVDKNFQIVDRAAVPVDPRWENFVDYLAEEMKVLAFTLMDRNDLDEKEIPFIGAGFPAPVDPGKGLILLTPNLPLTMAPIVEVFKKHCNIPLLIGNDANCAAFGEYHAGAGRDIRSMAMLTLGTGVGSGVVLDGKLYTGCNGTAAEAGHVLVKIDGRQCGCGRKGCLEAYASATALRRDTINAMLETPNSLLWDEAGGSLDRVTGETPFDAMHRGDEAAQKVVANYIHYLAQGIVNLINVLQPELVCLGGGVSNASEEDLYLPLRKEVNEYTMAKFSPIKTRIERAVLGNNAGIIGAALLGL